MKLCQKCKMEIRGELGTLEWGQNRFVYIDDKPGNFIFEASESECEFWAHRHLNATMRAVRDTYERVKVL